jgi:D-3-phosphoglycerate dehydrogenase / 2-oxoglutarate reductase
VSGLRILNIEPKGYSPKALAILEGLGPVMEQEMDRVGLIKVIGDYDILITRLAHRIDRQVFAAAPRLKVVVSATTGLDHIDLEAAATQGVEVLSLKGETKFLRSVTATAELAWGLLLTLVRRISAASSSVTDGNWDRDAFRGHELKGKCLGIVGLGRLGQMVADYGCAFGMTVRAYDPHLKDWPAGVDRAETLEDLFSQADVVSLHPPLNDETRGMIGFALLNLLPQGAVLINTSRGAVVDEKGLLEALKSRKLAGAGLDVLAEEGEGGVDNLVLVAYARDYNNLILTPHIGGATYESMEATEVFMAKKLKNFCLKTKQS